MTAKNEAVKDLWANCLYSLYCLEGVFSEIRLPVYGVLGNRVLGLPSSRKLGISPDTQTYRTGAEGSPLGVRRNYARRIAANCNVLFRDRSLKHSKVQAPPTGDYHTVCAAIRSPAQRRAVATTRRSAAARAAWAIRAPTTTPTAATSPTAVPRTKSTEP
jgi:hypothetical protein